MQYLKNEISTGYTLNAAFMNYVEIETVTNILQNNLRAIHDLESELFYRIGIHDGVSFVSGDFIFQNIGGI